MLTRRMLLAFAFAGAQAGCATTWSLARQACDGPDARPDEYEAYAVFLRERIDSAPLQITRRTLTGGMTAVDDEAPQWRQAIADYERRSHTAACLARLPAPMPAELRTTWRARTLSFSHVGFDVRKTVAVFEVQIAGPGEHDHEALVVALVRAAKEEAWEIVERWHMIASR